MKKLILLFATMIATQAHAGSIVCENVYGEDHVDYLRINGVLDNEGLLETRKDQPSTFVLYSKNNNLNISLGFDIDPDQDPGSPSKGWKLAKLNSGGARVKLVRDEKTGAIRAQAAVPQVSVSFSTCLYNKAKGDDEAIEESRKELLEPMAPETSEAAPEAAR